jgi:outer membrane receptor protein involved in Fe transport
VGNTPRRQPDVIYAFTPAYNSARLSVGANIIGVTDSYAQDNNDLKLKAYAQVNAFADYYLSDALTLSVNVNNLFDEVGLTEAEQGTVPDNGIITARSINGRSSTLTLKYAF